MNIGAIKRNCVSRRLAAIYDTPLGGQWVSNGSHAFRIDGLRLDADALEALFNLSDKQRAEMAYLENDIQDRRFRVEPMDDEEETRVVGALRWGDETYLGLTSSRGVMFIPNEPVRHIKPDRRGYGIRWDDGHPLVAVYCGLLCEALILPVSNDDTERLRDFAAALAAESWHWPDPDAEAARAEALAEQMLKDDDGGTEDDQRRDAD